MKQNTHFSIKSSGLFLIWKSALNLRITFNCEEDTVSVNAVTVG